jgi:predicted oxidoreductase
MGKIIDSNTEMEFKNHIEKYKDAENKLVKAITYANKYVDLIELFNEVDTQNVLSIDHLKAFVEARNNYFDKTESRQNSIIFAIRKIADDVLEKLDNDSGLTRSFKGPIITSNI